MRIFLLGLLLVSTLACGGGDPAPKAAQPAPAARPSLLLVTLDTTRADVLAEPATAPRFAALRARGLDFTNAYATAPTTLPSHASMMTGLYPAGHGLHENGRRLGAQHPVVAETLKSLGYSTAAFVSGFPLQRQFGLDRGFDHYDDELAPGGIAQRRGSATTERALAWLASAGTGPLFLWVHYYDPHEPYDPAESFRARFSNDLYRGEIAAMDAEVGRLVESFEKARPDHRLLLLADHGEGRGEHGEVLHGNLLYQGVMRVPLLMVGPGLAGRRDDAVSVRQVKATLEGWAHGSEIAGSLLAASPGASVVGEAMQPFLNYRWQPQVMATDGRAKLIRSGRLELYDLAADPGETNDLAAVGEPSRVLQKAIADYPLPAAHAPKPLDDEARRQLASLGYIASEGRVPTRVPDDAPRAADQTRLFADLDHAARLFTLGDYRGAAPLFEKIAREDPGNLMALVRLAVSQSLVGRDADALATFDRARRLDPENLETRHYLAQHLLKVGRPGDAAPHFEAVLAAQPERLPALEALAKVRAWQNDPAGAAALLERALPLSREPAPIQIRLALAKMAVGDTAAALAAFEAARDLQAAAFAYDLELGVLYLASRRPAEAAAALDRVPANHPERAMALFKRAQVAMLLQEPHRAERLREAWQNADPQTRELIRREPLFAEWSSELR